MTAPTIAVEDVALEPEGTTAMSSTAMVGAVIALYFYVWKKGVRPKSKPTPSPAFGDDVEHEAETQIASVEGNQISVDIFQLEFESP